MGLKTASSNWKSVWTHLALRQIGPQGLKNHVFSLVGRSNAPTDSVEDVKIKAVAPKGQALYFG